MFRRILLVAVGVLVVAQFAHAQSPRKLLTQANKLFAEGRYAKAFDVYKKGFDRASNPAPVFLRSMAFCKLKLLAHEDANKLFKQYMKKYPRAKDFVKIASTAKDLDIVVATKVTIKSTPPGATLHIDTEASRSVGKTPYVDQTITPGKHVAIVKYPGYETTRKTFTIPPKEKRTIEVPLKVGVRVTSEPSGATFHLDSADTPALGKTPLKVGIVPGDRKFFFKLAGYKTNVQAVKVSTNTSSFTSNLELGIAVTSTPAGAEVEIDGVKKGVTPLEDAATPGKHRVMVKMAGFRDFTHDIVVAPGATNKVAAVLQGGLLSMRTGPDGAKVKVGDLVVGTTPVDRVAVPMGEQTVTVEHADRRTWRQAISFNDNELLTANVKLGRPSWPAWTAAGVAVASLVVGAAAGLAAKAKVENADNNYDHPVTDEEGNYLDEGGNIVEEPGDAERADGACSAKNGDRLKGVEANVCGYGIHHVSTAGFVVAGVSTAFSILYYLLFVRPSEDISRQPVSLQHSLRTGSIQTAVRF